MNLPAHGTASPDPSITLKLKLKTHKSYSVGFSPGATPRTARLNRPRPPGGPSPPLGANAATDPLFPSHRLAGSILAARRLSVQGSLTLRLSPDGDQQAARRHIIGILQLIFFGTQF